MSTPKYHPECACQKAPLTQDDLTNMFAAGRDRVEGLRESAQQAEAMSRKGINQQRIAEFVDRANTIVTVDDVAAQFPDMKKDTVRKNLNRAASGGLIKSPSRGLYAPLSYVPEDRPRQHSPKDHPMSNPYIPSQEVFDEYRAVAENYDYRKTKPWPADCLIWRILDPSEEFPRRRWADHQVVEVSSNPYRPPAYVCHPYHLDTDALRDLLALEYAGLDVHIDGYSQYHPTAIRVVVQPTMKHFTAAHGPFDHFDADGNPVAQKS